MPHLPLDFRFSRLADISTHHSPQSNWPPELLQQGRRQDHHPPKGLHLKNWGTARPQGTALSGHSGDQVPRIKSGILDRKDCLVTITSSFAELGTPSSSSPSTFLVRPQGLEKPSNDSLLDGDKPEDEKAPLQHLSTNQPDKINQRHPQNKNLTISPPQREANNS